MAWPGRTFLHHMIDLLCCFREKDHLICLHSEFHLYLLWWHQFLSQWHGVSFWLFPGLLPTANMEVSSDAVGSLGYGAFLRGFWFVGSWASSRQQQSIAYKELFPVVIAAHVWGLWWCRKHVLFRSDIDAVVHIVNSRTSKVPCLTRLLHSLLLAVARYSFTFSAQHVPGVTNQVADALSHFCWQQFRQLIAHAHPLPTSILPNLLTDLTALLWNSNASPSSLMAWSPGLVVPMHQPRQNLVPSVNSWASCTLLGLHTLQTSGRFASLSLFWLEPSSTRPLRFIYLVSELSTSIRGSRIRLQTSSACRGSYVASSVARELLPPYSCLLQMT